jgi:hypothetical protein
LRIPENPGNVVFLFRNIAFRGKLLWSLPASTRCSHIINLCLAQFSLCWLRLRLGSRQDVPHA